VAQIRLENATEINVGPSIRALPSRSSEIPATLRPILKLISMNVTAKIR
jgi:hypothetical protein